MIRSITDPKRRRLYLLVLLFSIGFILFYRYEREPVTVLDEIFRRGEIRVITRNNAHCYYLYRNEPMGFEYDLARAFADYLGVELKVEVAHHWEEMIPDLLEGKGDFIASSLTITKPRRGEVGFSHGYLAIEQQIIVHRDNSEIVGPEDLEGREVHVRRGTTYAQRLQMMVARGLDIRVILHENLSTEELIRQVAEKEIEVTIADSNVAMLNRRYYPDAEARGSIGPKEHIGWAVDKGSYRLLERIDRFFLAAKQDGTFTEIYTRYYSDPQYFDDMDLTAFHDRIETRLPEYEPIIKEMAEQHEMDWRLIAAQIYQESHFKERAKSPAGAYGLMQLTRRTARSYGVADLYDPEENIAAGTRHLKKLYDFFDKATGDDRLLIALAAYNVGQGHILDARNLARDRNLDPNRWPVLADMLPLLMKEEFYNDAIYGYCRGTEPVLYVRRIMTYYDILKRKGIEAREPDIHDFFDAEDPT